MNSRSQSTRAFWSAIAVAAALSLLASSDAHSGTALSQSGSRTERVNHMVSLASGSPTSETASVRVAVLSGVNQAVAGARLRLRNATSGRVHGVGTTDALGQFAFIGVEAGTYAIEVVTEDGKVLAVGQRFGAAPGETITTFIRLGTEVPWFNGFFSNAALAVTTTAAVAGIMALDPGEQRPVSARK